MDARFTGVPASHLPVVPGAQASGAMPVGLGQLPAQAALHTRPQRPPPAPIGTAANNLPIIRYEECHFIRSDGTAGPRGTAVAESLYPGHVVAIPLDGGGTAYIMPDAMQVKSPDKPAWHQDAHRPIRKEIINYIASLLPELGLISRSTDPEAGSLAMSLERPMYYGAPSLEVYRDAKTLRARVEALKPFREYNDISARLSHEHAARLAQARPGNTGMNVGPPPLGAAHHSVAPPVPPFPGDASSATATAVGVTGSAGSAFRNVLPPGTARDMIKNLAHLLVQSAAETITPGAGADAPTAGAGTSTALSLPAVSQAGRLPSAAPAPMTVNAMGTPAQMTPGTAAHNAALRQQQSQRLLVLFHASRCAANPPESCTVKECPNMRKLWPHLSKCSNPSCQERHCMSSRYCLGHFRSCKESNCDVCSPVRQHIAEMKTGEVSGKRPRDESVPMQSTAKVARTENVHVAGGSGSGAAPPRPPSPQPPPALPKEKLEAFSKEQRVAYETYVLYYQRYLNAKKVGNQKEAEALGEWLRNKVAPKAKHKNKIDGDCTLVATFTKDQIIKHVSTLRLDNNRLCRPESIRAQVSNVLEELMQMDRQNIFSHPVDPVKDCAPHYFDIIHKPMDLATIKKRLDSCAYYTTFREFCEDVRLVWRNATTYNPCGTPVHTLATTFSTHFETRWSNVEQFLQRDFRDCVSHRDNENDQACSLCGIKELPLEPPSLYCNNCNTRVKKGATYYSTRSNKYHLCQACFGSVKKGTPIVFDDVPVNHKDMRKVKMEADATEGWVACDNCKKWQHSVCALYNSKRNEGLDMPYFCPHCIIGHMGARNVATPICRPIRGAKDIPQTSLSRHVEARIQALMEQKRAVIAADQEREPSDMEMPVFTFRVVSCVEKTLFPAEEMLKRYESAPYNYPSQLNYRSKAMLLFQNLGGVDVIVYAFYVQEYGDDCPEPNRRCAYLSYLDSVRYIQPKSLRTLLYQEILIAYTEYIKERGFNQVCDYHGVEVVIVSHGASSLFTLQLTLWSCPPQRGDDYIFYAHPEIQKVPRPERLREWYLTTFENAVRRGAAEKVMFLVDDYFPSVSPYGLSYAGHPSVKDQWPEKNHPGSVTHTPGVEGGADVHVPSAEEMAERAALLAAGYGPHPVGREEGADRLLSQLPYCEGDYWPGSIPTFFKELVDEAKEKQVGIDITIPGEQISLATLMARQGGADKFGDHGSDSDEGADVVGPPTDGPGSVTAMVLPDNGLDAAAQKQAMRGKANKKSQKARGRGRGRGGRLRSAGPSSAGEGGSVSYHPDDTFDAATGKRTVLAADGKPIPQDPLRDKVIQKLLMYARDFIVVKLRPSCQFCKRYITGGPGLDVFYRCLDCERIPALPLTTTGYGNPGKASAETSDRGRRLCTNLCIDCYEREAAAHECRMKGYPRPIPGSLLHHSHPITSFVPVQVEAAPGIQMGKAEKADAAAPADKGVEGAQKDVIIDSSNGVQALPPSKIATESTTSTAIVPVTNALPLVVAARPTDGVMVDPDSINESPFFATRQLFLNLCQGNHYQFDTLRRAKYSTMMVLWHMHHPLAPSFVHSCNNCFMAIAAHHRWNCATCTADQREDFDFCDSCYVKLGGAASHPHELQKIAVTGNGPYAPGAYEVSSSQSGNFADAAQLAHERAKALNSLLHAAACLRSGKPCGDDTCNKFINGLQHLETCQLGTAGCTTCRKIAGLILLHAEGCRLIGDQCPVPRCPLMKDNIRRKRGQQAAADALRRSGGNATGEQEAAAAGTAEATESAAPTAPSQSPPVMSAKAADEDPLEAAALAEAADRSVSAESMEKFRRLTSEQRRDIRTRVIEKHKPILEMSIKGFTDEPALAPHWEKFRNDYTLKWLASYNREYRAHGRPEIPSLSDHPWLEFSVLTRCVDEFQKHQHMIRAAAREEEMSAQIVGESARPGTDQTAVMGEAENESNDGPQPSPSAADISDPEAAAGKAESPGDTEIDMNGVPANAEGAAQDMLAEWQTSS